MGKQSKVDADRAKAEKRLEQEIGAGQTEEQLARAEKKAEGKKSSTRMKSSHRTRRTVEATNYK